MSVAHAAKQAARKLRAVKPVFVLLRGLFIGGDTIREVEPAANERRMIRVSQRVVRRSRRLDAMICIADDSDFCALEPSVWALKISCALYQVSTHAVSMP